MASDRLHVIQAAVEGFAERSVRRLVLELDARLRETTPVDTGWARANWIWSVGAPAPGPVGSRDAGGVGAASAEQAGSAAAVVASWRLDSGSVWCSNHVPYVVKLDAGGSTQAPAGFVRAAVLWAIAAVRRAVGL